MRSRIVRQIGISVEILAEHAVERLQGKLDEVDGKLLISVCPRFLGDFQEVLPEVGRQRGRDTEGGGIHAHGFVPLLSGRVGWLVTETNITHGIVICNLRLMNEMAALVVVPGPCQAEKPPKKWLKTMEQCN